MNSNKHEHDPKLTAYALGELSGSEREQIEALLRDDESARQVVEEIRSTATLVANGLKNESAAVELTAAQRAAIARASRPNLARFLIPVFASAALIALCYGVFMPSLNRAREVAVNLPQAPVSQPAVPSANQNKEIAQPKNDVPSLLQKQQVSQQFPGYANTQPQSGVVDLNDNMMMPSEPQDALQLAAEPAKRSEIDRIVVRGTRTSGPPALTPASETPMQREVAEGLRRIVRAPNNSPAGDDTSGDSARHARDRYAQHNTEAYDRITDNTFLDARQNPLSTFSIDVDTASYSNVRRFINEQSQLPPRDAVRIEEMINYFPYSYPAPVGDAPFGANIEVAGCPWNSDHRLVRIALKGKEIARENRPPSNLVFLIDVSGSMEPANKLPLLKRSMQRLVGELRENDRVAIVVYAGNSGLVLPSTICDERNQRTILDALERLQAGGSTNGAAGIQLAYQVATENFIKDGTNRVILCTDGDFNVGITNQGDLTRLIEEKAKSNVFLSVLGFGMGNVKDSTMEKLADKGNGNYAYIDTMLEANKVLVEQMSGTLITIAKDVKIQVEFNPAKVGAYRLIGYENRMLAKEDFNDDKKDAGEIGAGHTVTALYEIAPVGAKGDAPPVDPLKYSAAENPPATSNELLTVKLRYKAPDAPIEQGTSKLLEFPVKDSGQTYANASKDFKFASSVAAFGMVLRESPHKGNGTFDAVIELSQEGRGADEAGYRGEFIELVRKAKTLQRR